MRFLTPKFIIFFLLFIGSISTAFGQGPCLTCNGFGTVSVRKRVPVRKDVTYSYLGELTKTYTNVVYDTRHVDETCYACRGSGIQVRRAAPGKPATKPSPPTPPPPPPPTLAENITKRFGSGAKLSQTTVGKDRLRVVTYRAKSGGSVYALIRVNGNQLDVILEDYWHMFLTSDEYDRFNGLYLQDRVTRKYAMADNNGRIIYRSDHKFGRVNARGDIWQGTDNEIEVGGKSQREFKLINYKTGERLSPGVSLDNSCACKELWTQEGLIDVTLPHAVLGDRTAIGLMNREGELIVPPLYKRVLNCDISSGKVRFMDQEGYVYDFDYLGRLLTPTKEVQIKECANGRQIVRSKVLFRVKSATRYSEEKIELTDRVILRNPENPAVDGLIFREADCPDENGWAEVLPTDQETPMYLHTSGKLATAQEKSLAIVNIGKLPKVAFQRPHNRISEQWFVSEKNGSRVGGRLAYLDKNKKLVYRDIKPIFQRIKSRAPEQVMVQAANGLWGVMIRTHTIKPKYEEIYQINQWDYLGVVKGEMFLIDYDLWKDKLKVEAVKKFPSMRQGHFKNLLKYNQQVPHQFDNMAFRLKSYDISPNSPLSGREIIIDQPGDKRHQAYWFEQDKRHHLVVIIGNNDYYHFKLPAGTTDVADARYLPISDEKGVLYVPYRVGDRPYRLIEFKSEKFSLIEDPEMEFDAVYAVPIATEEGPHTLVFENASGYFTLSWLRKKGRSKKLTLELLGVK